MLGTWSGNTYRVVAHPQALYTIEEIGTERTMGYSNPGINLYVENTGDHYCWIDRPTVHAYLVSNKKHYIWERTA